MIRIVCVVGARPNFVKIAPLVRHIKEAWSDTFEATLVHTGQHYDEKLSQVFFEELQIPQPDVNLGVGSGTNQATLAGIGPIPPGGRVMKRLVLDPAGLAAVGLAGIGGVAGDEPDVVREAYEGVEDGVLSEEDFRDFVFGNPVRFWAGMNPNFFKGTAVESQVQKFMAKNGTATTAAAAL